MHKGELRVSWTTSAEVHDEATVRCLARRFQEELSADCLLHRRAVGFTPAVFLCQLTGPARPPADAAGKPGRSLYPLSPMQLGMMFHSVYDDTGTVYERSRTRTSRARPRAVQGGMAGGVRGVKCCVRRLPPGNRPMGGESVEVPLEGQDWRERASASDIGQAELARSFDLAAAPDALGVGAHVGDQAPSDLGAAPSAAAGRVELLAIDGKGSSPLLGTMTSPRECPARDRLAWLQGGTPRPRRTTGTCWRALPSRPTLAAAGQAGGERGRTTGASSAV